MNETDDNENEILYDVDAVYNASMEEYYEDGFPEFLLNGDSDSWWRLRREMDYDIDELEAYGDYEMPEEYRNYTFSDESSESERDPYYEEDDYREEDFDLEFREEEKDDKEAPTLEEAVDKMEEFVKYVQNLPTPEEFKIRTKEEKGIDSKIKKDVTFRNRGVAHVYGASKARA